MKNISKKGPLILSSIFFLILCFIFFFVYKEIDKNNKASEEAQRVWQTEVARRDEIKSFDHSMKEIEQEQALLETHFAKTSDIVPFFDILENTASLAGVKAEISTVDVLKDATGLVVGVKTSGSFSAIYKFLTLLENFPYELEIISVDLRQVDQSDISEKQVTNPKWDAVFKVKLLSFIQ
jgi:hypothetical protein